MNLSNDKCGTKRTDQTLKFCMVNRMIALLESLTEYWLWKLVLSHEILKSEDDSKFMSTLFSKLKKLIVCLRYFHLHWLKNKLLN